MAWTPGRETAILDLDERFFVDDGLKAYVVARISQIVCDLEYYADRWCYYHVGKIDALAEALSK